MSTQDIVQKLWNLCNVLRDDGITYHQYVTELTYILFLKMLDETGEENTLKADMLKAYQNSLEQYARRKGKAVEQLTEEEKESRKPLLYNYSWEYLTTLEGIELKNYYMKLLSELGSTGIPKISDIYAKAVSSIEEPKNLQKIISEINKLDWFEAKQEGLGDLYEGLLQKNADEKKSGAGQYFTPRVLIDVMTDLISPKLGEKCFDPACGTFTGELTAQWRKEHGVRIESWKNVSVSEICHSLKYGTSKKSVSQGKVVVIRMGNLQDGEIRWDDLAYSNDEEDIEKYRLFSGDVLFNRTNSSALVGKTSIYRGDYPAIYAGYLIKLDYDHSRIIGDFLNYSLNTIRAKKYYNLVKTDGVNQSNINAKKIGAYKFAMPNIKEQIEIVRILDDMFAKEQQVKQVAETVVEQIDLIKKSILSRAFRGELGTNNQNEESAVELVKEVVEKSVEINNKPKTKRTVIPEEIKSALSSSNEEEIIRLLIKSAPKAVSVQMIMSISKKKFELMDALRSLEQKQIVIKNSLGEYLLKR